MSVSHTERGKPKAGERRDGSSDHRNWQECGCDEKDCFPSFVTLVHPWPPNWSHDEKGIAKHRARSCERSSYNRCDEIGHNPANFVRWLQLLCRR